MSKFGLWLGLALLVGVCGPAIAVPTDSFDDGVVGTSQWVTGGVQRGWAPYPSGDRGTWSYSVDEILATDGYLNMHVAGPPSGATYGAEAWVRSLYDFHDGREYMVNFTWETVVGDTHYNMYFIQLTDGYISDMAVLHWYWEDFEPLIGTHTGDFLYYLGDVRRGISIGTDNGAVPPIPKSTWSLQILPEGIGRLYDGPNGTGALLHEAALILDKPWYLRFMVSDGTSSGFSGGDAALRLYSIDTTVIPEPASLTLLGTALLGSLLLRKGRK